MHESSDRYENIEHRILIHDHGGKVKWYWTVDKPLEIGTYSRILGRLDWQDTTDRGRAQRVVIVRAGAAISEDTLKRIIGSIPGYNEAGHLPPETTPNSLDHGFSQLLELATAFWQYDCAILQKFRDFGKVVEKRSYADLLSQPAQSNPKRSLEWLFIAVVFEWQLTFPQYANRALVSYDATEKLYTSDIYQHLPQDFRETVFKTRRDIFLYTYNYVRDSWISLYDPESAYTSKMNTIHSYFKAHRLRFDLRNPATALPENLHEKLNPNRLLEHFEIALGRGERVVPAVEHREERAIKSSHKKHSSRKSNFGSMIVHEGTSAYQAAKKTLRPHEAEKPPSIGPPSESDVSWTEKKTSLEKAINDWKTPNFLEIQFARSRFSDLRSKHILQPCAELETNGS